MTFGLVLGVSYFMLQTFIELAGMFAPMHTSEKMSVITFCHRTTHDMTSWSPEVEDEREVLVANVSSEVLRVSLRNSLRKLNQLESIEYYYYSL